MGRTSTGGVVEKATTRGTSYALRFRALGKRQFVHVGYAADGWNRTRAEQELQNVLADVRRGIWQPPEAVVEPIPRMMPTFQQFSSEWLTGMKLEGGRRGSGLSAAGANDLEWRLRHLLFAFGDKRLDEITIEDVDQFRRAKVREAERRRSAIAAGKPLLDDSGRVRRPLSVTSINKVLTTLSAVLDVAVEYELVARNVAKGRRRRLPVTRPRRTWLDRADHIAALLDGASALDAAAVRHRGQRRALLATLVFAGLRISEALALQWRDIDLARGTIHVRGTKTDAADRNVTILPVLRDELSSYRASLRDAPAGSIVFSTASGRSLGVTNARRRVLRAAVEKANEQLGGDGLEPLPDGLTPHSLRRTFASLLFAIGEPPPRVMGQMGHTTPNLTLAIYAREMDRRDGEDERLKALVNGEEWAPTGTSASADAVGERFTAAA